MDIVVGCVGLGIMGSAMSGNLIEAGFRVVGHDIDTAALDDFAAKGGEAAGSAREVGEKADVIVTSLPTIAAFHDVMAEIAAADRAGVIVVDTCTLPIADKETGRETLDAVGMILLDCPLSGTGQQARVKDLQVLASGDKAAYEFCAPVFDGFARAHVYVGPFGDGSRMKFVANHLINVHNVATAEAMVLGMKAGLDPQLIHEVIGNSAATSRMFEVRGAMMARDDYDDAGMKIEVWQKDLKVIGEYAASIGCPMPLFAAAAQPYYAALSKGLGAKDTAAVCAVLEEMADVKRGK